ncbi:M50 family metallopeptidase [Aquimarina sp. SS2-1]|uniref:M50 family metallopeptidase n=1 Tax=Aquimarina besae TaxID=3342247 RepID=UPI00366ABA83
MKKEIKLSKYLIYLLIGVISCIITVYIKKNYFIRDIAYNSIFEKCLLIIGTIVLSFVVIGIHELGHLITGLFQGFKFQLFVIGPLGIKREDDKTKLYLNKNLGYYGGIAATIPSADHPDNAQKFANVILAGPITSLFLAIILISIGYFFEKPLQSLLYTSGLISIGIFFATTIPSKSGMFFSDRKRYQRLTKPGKDQDVELALLRILGNYSKDNSYENVRKNDIDTLVSDDTPFIRFFGLSTLICFQLEKNRIIEEQVLEDYRKVSEKMPKSIIKAFDKEIEKYKAKIIEERRGIV